MACRILWLLNNLINWLSNHCPNPDPSLPLFPTHLPASSLYHCKASFKAQVSSWWATAQTPSEGLLCSQIMSEPFGSFALHAPVSQAAWNITDTSCLLTSSQLGTCCSFCLGSHASFICLVNFYRSSGSKSGITCFANPPSFGLISVMASMLSETTVCSLLCLWH